MYPDTFDLARIVIEFRAPFRVGGGGDDDLVDSVFITDASGLPTLPGASLAGVLRHAVAARWGRDVERSLFGFQQGDDGQRSRVSVSWGVVHDRSDRPVRPRGVDWRADPVLSLLRGGLVRDRVRLNGRGVVDGRGKFDEQLVPSGARFTVEITLDLAGQRQADPGLDALIGLLSSPALRLGGGTRRGLGEFSVVRARGQRFDLRRDRRAFCDLSPALWESDALPELPITPGAATGVHYRLRLRAQDLLLVGSGQPFGAHSDVDMQPLREDRIEWSDRTGSVRSNVAVIPAAGTKGALRHRTLFHIHRLDKDWADGETSTDGSEQALEQLALLFGEAKGDAGRPGRVFPTDLVLNSDQVRLEHVAKDAFTQGPIDGALFDEAPIWAELAPLDLDIVVDYSDREALREPFEAALRDLCEGRLALGGGSSRGHGYFSGKLQILGGDS